MDTLPLPPRPSLDQYRRRAKELVKVAASPDEEAVHAWAAEWLATLTGLRGGATTPFAEQSFSRAVASLEQRTRTAAGAGRGRLSLTTAQFLIAQLHGFSRWRDFAGHIEHLAHGDALAAAFEQAADAVVAGDLSALTALLRRDRALVTARSERDHRATLLHYIAANGVEDFRQMTPANAVEVARALLDARAEVDALANTYGGGNAQTTLNLLVSSMHPAEAGLQPALAETLLDYGAAVNGLDDDASPLMTPLAFRYGEAADALVRRGARVDNALAAAAVGDVELLRDLVDRASAAPAALINVRWLSLPPDTASQLELALVWACTFGRIETAAFLLGNGVDAAAADTDGMTALHWAAANRHLDVIELLLEHGASLEAKNRWGGTVLGSTTYFVRHRPAEALGYVGIIDRLLSEGADARSAAYPTGNETLDELLRAQLGGDEDTPSHAEANR